MNDIDKFQELIGETLRLAKAQDSKINRQTIKKLFEDMELNDKQFDQIVAYLAANKIEVEGYTKEETPIDAKAPETSATSDMKFHVSKGINAKDTAYLNQYYDEIKDIREADREEEIRLFSRVKQGDTSAKSRLIEINLRKVVEIAGEYKNQGMSAEDLIQEGNIALIQSLEELPETDDLEAIKDFIYDYVRTGILAALKEQQESDDLEGIVTEKINRLFDALKELEEMLGRKANIHDLAEYTKLTEEEIRDIIELSADALELDHVHEHHEE